MKTEKKRKAKGKKFSRAVTLKKPNLWDQGLKFEGSALPIEFQKSLLKDWLLSDQPFEEICRKYGLDEEETLSLKMKLPQNVIALKDLQVTENFALVGRGTGDDLNRKAVLTLISDGLRLSRKVRVIADLQFSEGALTPSDLSKLVGSWDKILRRVGTFLTSPELEEEEGFRALMQMTRDELGDLKKKIQEYRHYKLQIPEAEVLLEDGEEKVESADRKPES